MFWYWEGHCGINWRGRTRWSSHIELFIPSKQYGVFPRFWSDHYQIYACGYVLIQGWLWSIRFTGKKPKWSSHIENSIPSKQYGDKKLSDSYQIWRVGMFWYRDGHVESVCLKNTRWSNHTEYSIPSKRHLSDNDPIVTRFGVWVCFIWYRDDYGGQIDGKTQEGQAI